jgi:thiamine pyrophosphokinase
MRKVLIVLAGADMSIEDRRAWASGADLILAADAGADRLLEAGIDSFTLVGDLDSVSPEARARANNKIVDYDEATTDFDKALAFCRRVRLAEEVVVIGSEGDQFDHSLATLYSAAKTKLRVIFGLRNGLGLVLKRGTEVTAQLAKNARVSLLPIVPCSGVSLAGVVWPLEDARLSPLKKGSISNRAEGPIAASIRKGVALLFVESPAGRWPDEVFS